MTSSSFLRRYEPQQLRPVSNGWCPHSPVDPLLTPHERVSDIGEPRLSAVGIDFSPMKSKLRFSRLALCFVQIAGAVCLRASTSTDLPFPLIQRFEKFGINEGIPYHKVHCVLTASDSK